MRENDEMTGLFRSRLSGAEMEVRNGFWEELEKELVPVAPYNARKYWLSPRFQRMAAVASVLLVLGVASAAFWYFSPKEEIKEAFTQVAVLASEGNIKGDVVQESFPSIHQASSLMPQASGITQQPGNVPVDWSLQEENETVSLHVSITISQRMYGNDHSPVDHRVDAGYAPAGTSSVEVPEEQETSLKAHPAEKSGKWALKAAVGTSLPKDSYHQPFAVEVTAERRLNKCLSLEAGLQYNYLSASGGETVHSLGIPVKLNLLLASSPKVDFYAIVGGMAEKCIAGLSDNSFRAEPVRLSAGAGVGVRYKMNDRFALFAEPSVSYHFSTDSPTRTIQTERPANLNLLCGVRMTY